MTASIVTHEARSLSEFIERLKELTPAIGTFHTYRGERNIDWKLAPSIMRPGREALLKHERDIIRELISVHPNEFLDDQSMFDRLVRMQHFGLPTRLLDVTNNPLIALFNATETVDSRLEFSKDGQVYYAQIPENRRKYFDSDTVSCVANISNLSDDEKMRIYSRIRLDKKSFNDEDVFAFGRLVQFVRIEKPSFKAAVEPAELDTIWYVMPKLSNRRIIAQNGAFIIFGLTSHAPAPEALNKIIFRSILIPKRFKEEIRQDLKKLGITQSSLFPEIDKAAAFIIENYRS